MLDPKYLDLILKDDCRVNMVQFSMPAIPAKILPPNPQRFAVVLPGYTGGTASWGFADSQLNVGLMPFTTMTNSGPIILSRVILGDLICYPLWGAVNTGTPTLMVMEVSFAYRAWQGYVRMRNECFSQLATP